jgi:hypothetical protein
MLAEVILALIATAFLLFLAIGAVSWVGGIVYCVVKALRGESAPTDRRSIEQDSAGLDF